MRGRRHVIRFGRSRFPCILTANGKAASFAGRCIKSRIGNPDESSVREQDA